jgi:pimeloyl-ACP methyl ester carboxylesterase
MTKRRRIVAGLGVLVVAAGALVALAPAAGASTAPAEVTWSSCPAYSDEAIETLVPKEQLAAFRALLARTRCGTVQVPLDHTRPSGEKITIAITRLAAADQKHKLGSIAMNPGGPGGAGYLMPQFLSLASPQVATLAERYDLIGFDPRGIGYSTKVTCPRPDDNGPIEFPPGPITEATAKQVYDGQVAANRACWQSNPAFLRQLTTANVARDLDRVRRALGLERISYFGASWGTLLGSVYRSLYPQSVARMWLDSVVGPTANRLDSRFHDVTAASERNVSRWAAWAAARDATYGLGGTTDEVMAFVQRRKAELNAEPIVFSDVAMPLDGNFIAFLTTAPSPLWSEATAAMAAMATARTGDPVPDAVKPIVTPPPPPPADQPPADSPPADAPEPFNGVASTAILCNDDTSPHDFPTFWSTFQRWQHEFPITGSLAPITQLCAGWPVPSQPFQLRKSNGSLQLSAHRYETSTPYEWAAQIQSLTGGTVFTVDDDIHGSVPSVPECAEHVRAYFLTGRPDARGCQGVTSPVATVAADTATPLSTRQMPTGTRWSWRYH